MDLQTADTIEERAKRNLERQLGPELLAVLHDPRTFEIMRNPDSTLWLERVGEPISRIGTMSNEKAQAIVEVIAGIHRKEITRSVPLLECELPLDGSRFAGQFPPVVSSPSFAIRKRAVKVFSLDEYVAKGEMTQRQRQVIVDAIRARRNIFLSGGTGSGKTTLANAILSEVVACFPDERLLILEDTGEIQCTAKNHIQYHTTADVTLRDLIRMTLRMRPDRIIVGETRGAEALDLLMAMNTGHEGGLATIHANGARATLSRLAMLISMNVEAPRPLEPLIAEAVHLIVHIAKTPQGRRVQEILEVSGYRDGAYITTSR